MLLFLHYFPGLSLADFATPNGFPAELYDGGRELIKAWMKAGV